MSFTLSTIRAAIGDQLRANLDRQTTVDEHNVSEALPRVSLVLDETPSYFLSFGPSGIASVRFSVLIVPGGVDKSAVMRLDDYLSVGTGNGSSVIDALKSDPTFGGVAETFEVEPGEYDAAGIVAELLVTVHVRKQGAQA